MPFFDKGINFSNVFFYFFLVRFLLMLPVSSLTSLGRHEVAALCLLVWCFGSPMQLYISKSGLARCQHFYCLVFIFTQVLFCSGSCNFVALLKWHSDKGSILSPLLWNFFLFASFCIVVPYVSYLQFDLFVETWMSIVCLLHLWSCPPQNVQACYFEQHDKVHNILLSGFLVWELSMAGCFHQALSLF